MRKSRSFSSYLGRTQPNHPLSHDRPGRAVRRLRSAAQRTRVEPARILRERQDAIDQLNRRAGAHDPETGKAYPFHSLDSRSRSAPDSDSRGALPDRGNIEQAADVVLEHAADVAAAVRSERRRGPSVVEHAVAQVVQAASRSTDELPGALDEAEEAATVFRDVAAGRAVTVPPPPALPDPEPPSPLDVFVERWTDVAEHAARHMHVDHLPYDEFLHTEVLALAADCASMPQSVSLLEYGIDRNAAAATAILKNATDRVARGVAAAAALQREAAAAYHLRRLHGLAQERAGPSGSNSSTAPWGISAQRSSRHSRRGSFGTQH